MFVFLYVVSDLQSDTVYYLDFQSANINAMASVLLCCGLKNLILISVGAQIRCNGQEHPLRRASSQNIYLIGVDSSQQLGLYFVK